MSNHFDIASLRAVMQDSSQIDGNFFAGNDILKARDCLPHELSPTINANVALGDPALEEFLHTSSFDANRSQSVLELQGQRIFKNEANSSPPISNGVEAHRRQNASTSPISAGADAVARAAKKGTRFSRAVLSILKGWVEDHRDNPYPDEAEKERLKRQTGLSSEQISNWFTNTRRRERIRTIKRAPSPSIRAGRPIAIIDNRGWESLNPMERWRNSPPEQDPAPLAAIKDAARDLTPLTNSNYFDNSWNLKRTPSTSSFGDAQSASDGSSVSAFSTTFSQDSHGSFGSFMSYQSNQSKQSQRRRRRVPTTRNKSMNILSDKSRIFHCTFCTDKFKTKHDWARHEKTLHLSLEKWICEASANPITLLPSGQKMCAFCEELDPSIEHMEMHKHLDCYEKGLSSRTFYRKDHLDQHLRLMHNCKITKNMESWKVEVTDVKSRCGFCSMEFTTWQQRKDHLAKEFRTGRTMKDWKGDRGFDPNTAALVSNSLPPYLIHQEAKAPLAFSASNKASLFTHQQWSEGCAVPDYVPDITNRPNSGSSSPYEKPLLNTNTQIPVDLQATNQVWEWPNSSSFWEFISFHLSLYVEKCQTENVPITPDMLRREARTLKYGDPDDVWDLTPADDPYWLHLFMQAHGIVPLEREFSLADLIQEFGLMTTLGFNKKDPGLYSLDGISDVLLALSKLGTIPSACVEQIPIPMTQTGMTTGGPSSTNAFADPLVVPGSHSNITAGDWTSGFPSNSFLNASSNVGSVDVQALDSSCLYWNNLTELSLLDVPGDIGDMEFSL